MDVAEKPTSLSIKAITESWMNRTLRPNEEHQRGEAWSVSQQKLLIDSILRGYPLPRFYFHKKTSTGLLGDSASTFDIIDGQQRIIAMAEFVSDHWNLFDMMGNDKVPLPRSIRALPCPWSGRTFPGLDEQTRERFLKTEVPVVVIDGVATPDEIRDLFIRLQAGTALTRQQVRDAWPGTVGPYVISLAGKLKSQPRFKSFSAVDKRGVANSDGEGLADTYLDDRQTCAQLLCLLVERDEKDEISSVMTQALDNLYHANIEFDSKGKLAKKFERLLGWCDEILNRRPTTKDGRPIKVRKNLLFSIFLLLEDMDTGSANVDHSFLVRLAKATWDVTSDQPEPVGRVSSVGQIAKHYHWLVHTKLKGLEVSGYDTARLFDGEQRAQIWEKFDGRCAICGGQLESGTEEYDHILPWIRGGPTSVENGRPVHKGCHERGRNVGLAPVSSKTTVRLWPAEGRVGSPPGRS
jgi:hypothetical protein